jgi:four helix bundle suffix protein
MSKGFLPPSGQFKKLRSYQASEIIYDITFFFCHKHLKRGDRTVDQMVQAARSGKQNIAEGSLASATSKETEIKLTNVARASLGELLIDYEDFLRVRNDTQWDKDSVEAIAARKLGSTDGRTFENTYKAICETRSAETIANLAICLIHQAQYLLGKQLQRLERDFTKEGGIRERMTKARLTSRVG